MSDMVITAYTVILFIIHKLGMRFYTFQDCVKTINSSFLIT